MRLSELQKLGNSELRERFIWGKFPFDYAGCGKCVSQHGFFGCREHEQFAHDAAPVGIVDNGQLRRNLSEIFALRLFYADLYANPVPAHALIEEPTETKIYAEVS